MWGEPTFVGRVGFLCLARAPQGPSGLELFPALGVTGQTLRAASQLSPSCRDPRRFRQCLHAMGRLSGLGTPQCRGDTCSAAWQLRGPCKYSLVGAGGRDAEPGRSVPRVLGQHFEVACRRQGRAAPPARLSCLKSQGVPAGAEPAQTPWCRAGGCWRSALGTPLSSGAPGGDARLRVSSQCIHTALQPQGRALGGRPVPVSPEQGWSSELSCPRHSPAQRQPG